VEPDYSFHEEKLKRDLLACKWVMPQRGFRARLLEGFEGARENLETETAGFDVKLSSSNHVGALKYGIHGCSILFLRHL